ncbi:membrane bound O-acyl transferase family-domain-containing protein [Phaeosphaeriaceae sp. PMI808]|nr:membrane bound O-acyl transferase family-domain-containing protein [Phaeosphaeriaceae sp. PMI808]
MISLELPKSLIDLQLPLLFANNIIALAIGPRNHVIRIGVTLPILIVLAIQSCYKQKGDMEWGNRYGLECLVLHQLFVYIDWNVLCNPDKEKWHKIQYSAPEPNSNSNTEKNTVPHEFLARTWWGIRLATGARYVGWSNQVKNVPVECDADYSRLKSLRALFFYLFVDIIYAYTASSPHGSWSDITHIKTATSYADRSYLTRWWFAWVHVILTYVTLAQVNAIYSVVSVATGLANPRDCPNSFGNLRELVTVRNAWSFVWHQQCRRICSTLGIFIARDVLRIRKGSFASKYVQLFVGFGISGIVHGCASMLLHGSCEDDAAFAFFLGQASIIMIEDHIIDFGKKLGFKDSRFWRLVGFVWTIFVIGASTERWTGSLLGHGMWVHARKPDYFSFGPQVVV